MAIRDNVTISEFRLIDNVVPGGNGTHHGNIIDTADYDLGNGLFFCIPQIDVGTFNFALTEGEDPALGDGTDVPPEKIIGVLPTINSVSADGSVLNKVGVFSNKRYLRVSLITTGLATDTPTRVMVMAILGKETC